MLVIPVRKRFKSINITDKAKILHTMLSKYVPIEYIGGKENGSQFTKFANIFCCHIIVLYGVTCSQISSILV